MPHALPPGPEQPIADGSPPPDLDRKRETIRAIEDELDADETIIEWGGQGYETYAVRFLLPIGLQRLSDRLGAIKVKPGTTDGRVHIRAIIANDD